MKLGYFVHDVHDPAVLRRIVMLQKGGADVVVLGFRRSDSVIADLNGAPVTDLGRSFNAQLARRAGSVLTNVALAARLKSIVADVDVIMARNLETLAIAARFRQIAAPRASLVYECLDIHRMMLGGGVPSRLLRALEQRLLQASALLVVSSPAFLRNYFEAIQHAKTPALLIENKVVVPDAAAVVRAGAPQIAPGRPWRIGWYGMIRCGKSLNMLADLVRANPGLVEVVIRGRPSYNELPGFQAIVDETPGVSFEGPYTRDDLERIYNDVHFTWAIDYFEEGQNSDWLLPNRLYEGALHGPVPIALAGVQTGRWLAEHEAGILLADPVEELPGLLGRLTAEHYAMLTSKTAAIPTPDLVADDADSRRLVEQLRATRRP